MKNKHKNIKVFGHSGKGLNKKAFSLSINFLVTMIIMVVLFGFGISLFTTIFNNAVELNDQVHQQELDRMNKVLDNGDIVTVLNPQQTAEKDALRFPIGISNENSDAGEDVFKIIIKKQTLGGIDCNYNFIPNDGDGPVPECLNDVILLPENFEGGFSVKNNERVFRLIQIVPKHHPGFYTIKFRVNRSDENYGKLQMIWVTVP